MSFYQPLDDAADEIRLLRVHPAEHFDDALITTLQTVSLRNPPPYSALSYAWGDAHDTRPITVGSAPHAITANLDSALRHARDARPGRDAVLWADALCINQRDTRERTAQVARMADVFGAAARVLAWLGPAADDSDAAMDAMARVPDETHHSRAVDAMIAALTLAEARALTALLARPFLTRRWITQEVVLGRAVDVVCGRRACSFDTLARWARASAHYIGTHPDSAEPLTHELLRAARDRVYDWRYLRGERGGISLLEVLHRQAAMRCSDPRDRLYAVMGLATDAPFLRPDYARPAREVLLDFAVRHMESTASLEVILQAHEAHEADEERAAWGLPSWVPTWYSPDDVSLGSPEVSIPVPDLSRSRDKYFSISEQRDVLHVKGLVLDTVASRGADSALLGTPVAADAAYPTGMPLLQAHFRHAVRDEDPFRDGERLRDGSPELFLLAAGFLHSRQFLLADRPPEPLDYVASFLRFTGQRRAGRSDDEILRQFAAPAAGSAAEWPDTLDLRVGELSGAFLREASEQSAHSALLATEGGYLGTVLGPMAVERGDVVAALAGLGRLAALRRVGGRWKFVGPCWFLGLEGEGLYDALDGRREGVEVVDFDIY